MTTLNLPTSAWISKVEYVRRAPDVDLDGHDGLLVTTMRDGRVYVAAVKSWVVGLLVAVAKTGGSTGRAWSRLVRGKWPISQRAGLPRGE